MHRTWSSNYLPLLGLLLVPIGLHGQAASQARNAIAPANNLSAYKRLDGLAIASRHGNAAATTELSRQLFTNVAIPTDVAESLGFTDRIVHAELAYRAGAHRAVHEEDIVRAANAFAGTVGAPEWTRTNLLEVRKLRMHAMTLYPQLLAYQGPPNEKGEYKALDDNISPLEVSYLATSLLYQKAYNADYQFTQAERADNARLPASEVHQKHLQRTSAFANLLHGRNQSISTVDLLSAADRFFSDLGVEPHASSAIFEHHAAISNSKVGGR